jgi:hypothetical protein
MRKISVYQIDAFTGKPFSGNPAAVIKTDILSDKEMQLIASEMNLSETAFLGNSDKADYKLRWFTPALEVDLCGHATIASLHYLRETGELRRIPKLHLIPDQAFSGAVLKTICTLCRYPHIDIPNITSTEVKYLLTLACQEKTVRRNLFCLKMVISISV